MRFELGEASSVSVAGTLVLEGTGFVALSPGAELIVQPSSESADVSFMAGIQYPAQRRCLPYHPSCISFPSVIGTSTTYSYISKGAMKMQFLAQKNLTLNLSSTVTVVPHTYCLIHESTDIPVVYHPVSAVLCLQSSRIPGGCQCDVLQWLHAPRNHLLRYNGESQFAPLQFECMTNLTSVFVSV